MSATTSQKTTTKNPTLSFKINMRYSVRMDCSLFSPSTDCETAWCGGGKADDWGQGVCPLHRQTTQWKEV